MINSHYVPRLVLKQFAEKDKICLYDVRTGEYREGANIKHAFARKGLYDDEVEKNLNFKIESQFGSLFANKICKFTDEVVLSRDELYLIKKFLLISAMRTCRSEEWVNYEKNFYERSRRHAEEYAKARNMSSEQKEIYLSQFVPPFEEKQIDGETPFDYWMRTMNVILETDGTVKGIFNHPDKTYPAHRWAKVMQYSYLAFWDTKNVNDEFIITDIGMTSENELGWNGVTVHNLKKTLFLRNCYEKESDVNLQRIIYENILKMENFTENFMMFPVSSRRMIALICPFYKFRILYGWRYSMPDLRSLTNMPDENLFFPNDVKYVKPQPDDGSVNEDDGDRYIYEIKNLTREQVRYCNSLFLDRINEYAGFSSLGKAVGSLLAYKNNGYRKRVDYSPLYKIIQSRYGG